jgi:hypothetical protein
LNVRWVLLVIVGLDVRALSAQDSGRWDRADSAVVRLAPSAFPQLPPEIRADLVGRGCRVPQTYLSQRPHNVVAGRLTHAQRPDWAVLCSVARVSRVLVYRAESGLPDSLALAPDRKYLQGWGGDSIVYSREIVVLRGAEIREDYGNPALPVALERDGINDAFAGKTSVVHYWQDGKWRLIESNQ